MSEEDIKLLEEMKQNCLTKREYVDSKAERKAQAIENLINRNRELEERIIYLVNERKKLEELLFASNENYIEKSKVKDKIEKLEDKIHLLRPNASISEMMIEFKNEGALEILYELLEEK